MKNSLITTIILTCFAAQVNASDSVSITSQLSTSLARGSIKIETSLPLNITPEIAEIIKQINNSDLQFDEPILIFSDDDVIINNSKALTEVLSATNATVTSF